MTLAEEIPLIPLPRLALALIPVGVVLVILNAWSIGVRTSVTAFARMLFQLMLLGYLLGYLFQVDSSLVVIGVLTVMLLAASWISLRVVTHSRSRLFFRALTAILIGGGVTLAIVTQGVLQLRPWYLPRTMIPLAGMIFSSSMNAVSLAIERFLSEVDRGEPEDNARRKALEASLIPTTNSLFAVGLVSIPGMMTGQVLAATSPLIAARYQIMVMCMVFAAAGLSVSLFLFLVGRTLRPSDVPGEAAEQESH